jgi:pyruvate dehydrogenase E2 component (dihydrolipoamide acetyltransferase)
MPTEIRMPRLNWSQETGTVTRWLKSTGEFVKAGEPLLIVETEKAEIEVEADANGFLHIVVLESRLLPVGALIGYLLGDGEAAPVATGAGTAAEPRPSAENPIEHRSQGTKESQRLSATPVARRIAKEHNIDLALVVGSGPQGTITERDIRRYVGEHAGRAGPLSEEVEVQQAAGLAHGADESVFPLTSIRKATAERLAASFASAPHFYLSITVDMSAVLNQRAGLDPKPSITAIFVWAVAVTLATHPAVNVSYREGALVKHAHINIGVAIATPEGLLVPVIRDAEQLSVSATDERVRQLREKAQTRRFRGDEFSQGTFTISNLGMLGTEEFLAVINPPEAAILAVGAMIDRAYAGQQGVELRPSVKLNLSIDHRAIDGADAARFLTELKRTLEQPESLA